MLKHEKQISKPADNQPNNEKTDPAEDLGKALLGGGLAELVEGLVKASKDTIKKAQLQAQSEENVALNRGQASQGDMIEALVKKLEKAGEKDLG